MAKIGLTGGIGAGKSTVAFLFSKLGVPVLNADQIARDAYLNDAIKEKVIDLLGDVYFPDKSLNREKVASIIFNDNDKLYKIERIIHPYVELEIDYWCKIQKKPFVIIENAIIFEKNDEDSYNKMISVVSPIEKRIERVIKRNNCTREDVIKRINKQQITDIYRVKNSDYVIYNNGLKEDLEYQINLLYDVLIS